MELSLRVGDMSFSVFCKFEIVIFNIVQFMTENIYFAFLYVLSIFFFTLCRNTGYTDIEKRKYQRN